jgi:VCBS repeat-containing protein
MPVFKRMRSAPVAPATGISSIGQSAIRLEKRYVFDAALAGEIYGTALAGECCGQADTGGPTLSETLVAATQNGQPASETGDNLGLSESAPASSALYVIDANVDQKDTLIAGLPEGAEVLLLDPSRDGVTQIAEALTGRSNVGAVHIFAHGEAGALTLGSSVLDAETMNSLYRSTLVGIGSHLSADADIMIYGCNFASGSEGTAAADLLSALTGADVAASEDLTGAARLGGDWDLEYSAGTIETNAFAFAAYDATLAPPVAVSETYSTSFNTPVSGNVSPNDSDPENDPLTFSVYQQPGHGSVSLNSDGSFTYTPNSGFSGEDFFIYRVTDNTGSNPNFANASATIIVAPGPNNPPDAVDDSYSTTVDTPVAGDVCANDTDADGDTLTHTIATNPTHGSVTLNTDGTFTYTPNSGYTGVDTFTYTSDDGNGGTDTATVTVTITAPVNNPPNAVNDSYSTTVDTPVAGDVCTNDTDADGDLLSHSLTTGPSNGTVTLNTDGTFTYTPNSGYTGVDTFTYTSDDGNGGTDTATVTVTVSGPTNNPPNAVNDSYSTSVNTPVAGDVCTNDTDADGDLLSHSLTTGPSNGTVTLNTDGTFTYTPNSGYTGVDTFTYTSSDGNGGTDTATVTVTVSGPTNNPPNAVNDSYSTSVNTPVAGDVCTNDTDADGDTLTHTIATGPSNGTVTLNTDGTFTYTPNSGYTGVDTFTYMSSDGNGGTDTATVTVTVSGPTNNPPNAVNDSYSTSVNTPVAGDVCTNDTDADGDTLTHTIATGPAHGTVTLNTDGTFTYTPTTGYTGVDTFTYTSNDGNGGTDTATVTVTVSGPTNNPPNAVNDSFSTNEDAPVTGDVCVNDTDADGDTLTHSVATNPTHGTLTLNANGTFTYTPNPGYTGTDTFTYTSSDGNGGTDTATVTVTVLALNDAPVIATPVPNQVGLDGQITNLNLSTNVTDADSPVLIYAASGLPPGLSINPLTGTVTGTIDRLASEVGPTSNGVYTVSLTVVDLAGGVTTQDFTWTVTNPGPDAVNDSFSTNAGTLLTGTLATNDSDPDRDALTFCVETAPANGTVTVNANGTFSYTPRAGFVGSDSFTYCLTDSQGASDTATATITVLPVNSPPVAVNDSYATQGTLPVSGTIATNDSEPDGDPVVFAATSQPANGTLIFNSNGSFIYTARDLFTGTDSFTYSATDPSGASSSATASISVASTPIAPPSISCVVSFGDLSYLRTLLLSGNYSFSS